MSDEFLFVEKYRPRTIDECILPKSLTTVFKAIVEKGELPNMMFSGSAGVGKTTVAKALCNELDLDYIIINASEDSGIDVLRKKIRQFASSVSLSGGYKVVILDEADYLNAQSTQPALRGFIEEFSNNCRFILTCNFKNKIIEPLHSRCSVYEFQIPVDEKAKIAAKFFKRLQVILQTEGVEYDQAALAVLVEKHFPDWRRVLNEVQRHSISGRIDAGSIVDLSDANFGKLAKALKEKDFKAMRKWVVDNKDIEPTAIYRKIYDSMYDYVKPTHIPQVVLTIAEYEYKAAFVADQEINMVACMTELMIEVEWK